MKKITNRSPQALGDSDPMASLRTKLKAANPEIQHYVTAMEAENLALQRKVARLQAKNVSAENRILALTEDIEEKNRRLHDMETLDPELEKMIERIGKP